jgi:6-phosphogluconolactonase (cycloisomerase 2 family)
MEIKLRMSKRFGWLLGAVGLVAIAFLAACGTKYSSSYDGLVLVGSQGSNVIQSFSFDLGSGHVSEISKPPGTTGLPSSMVVDPAGAYAYTIVSSNDGFQCGSNATATVGIQSFKVNSGGALSAGSCTPDPNAVALNMDAAGKFLFVAEGLNSVAQAPNSAPCIAGGAAYGVCVYSIGGDGSLTAVPGTFTLTLQAGFQTPDFVALAATPTVFPAANAVCSTDQGSNPPTSEFLYVTDSVNNVVWEFGVDPSSGALGNPPGLNAVPWFAARSVPSGVAVDPCNRFVYVANLNSNNISAYTICNGGTTQASNCPATPDGGLLEISESPISIPGGANGPGPLVVDPFGNSLYVVDTLSSQLSAFKISPVSGSLTAASPAVVATGALPKSIAIRSDDTWLFVANYGSASVSQFSITPATGALSVLPAIETDNSPWGVAVK